MKHKFNVTFADGVDATLVKPSNWNDTHSYGFRSVSANGNILSTDDVVLGTGGSGAGITLTLPSPTTNLCVIVRKVDAGVGPVIINPNAAETIDGQSSWQLVNQWQFVELASDGTNWHVMRIS